MTASVRLQPMSEAELASYLEGSAAGYAEALVSSGSLPEPEARVKAEAGTAELRRRGRDAADQLLWTAYSGDEPVGIAWVEITERSDGLRAYVNDVEVLEEHRGRGLGRAVMEAIERECRDRGAKTIGLNVFGDNHRARSLYESLGYVTTSVQMSKPLG